MGVPERPWLHKPRRRRSWAAALRVAAAASLLLPSPRGARADEPPAATTPTAADLDARLRRLEEQNRRLIEQNEALRRTGEADRERQEERYRELADKYDTLRERLEAPPDAGAEPEGEGEATAEPLFGAPEETGPELRPERDGGEAPELPLMGRFGEGFGLATPDDEFSLRFHVLDQTDFKVFSPNNLSPARSGLYIPRVRVYLEGQLTRPFNYEVSLQRSLEGTWDLLDANLDVRPNEAFGVRFGRQLVPYSYAWYDHLEQDFIVPERSLFPLNFGLSRSAGLLAHGRVLDGRLQYAAGGFDGRLAGIADNNTTRDAVGYLNFRPFGNADEGALLRNLNIGASGFLGQQVSPQSPLPLRTSVQSSENDEAARAASISFLEFEKGVASAGGRSAGAVHLAWYGRGVSFEGEVQAGRFDVVRHDVTTSVPSIGGHATLAYFLTGEVIDGRGPFDPLRPFEPARGRWGPGAFEAYVRYSHLDVGRQVFEAELANPDEWTRSTWLTDVGVNWYWNRWIKLYFDWQHAGFGSPVLLNPNSGYRALQNDLFWIRCQVYF